MSLQEREIEKKFFLSFKNNSTEIILISFPLSRSNSLSISISKTHFSTVKDSGTVGAGWVQGTSEDKGSFHSQYCIVGCYVREAHIIHLRQIWIWMHSCLFGCVCVCLCVWTCTRVWRDACHRTDVRRPKRSFVRSIVWMSVSECMKHPCPASSVWVVMTHCVVVLTCVSVHHLCVCVGGSRHVWF